MSDNLKHPEFGEVQIAPINQAMMVAFYRKLRESGAKAEDLTICEYAGELVTAAVAAGWFPGLVIADVENMKPHRVMWIYCWIVEFLNSINHFDPNSFGLLSSAQETPDSSPQKN